MVELVDRLRAAIVHAYPELRRSKLRLLAEGWHSTSVEVDGQLIFKFLKNRAAETALLREAPLLGVVRLRMTHSTRA
jgi:hypothetical protein